MVCLCLCCPLLRGLTIRSAVIVTLSLSGAALLLSKYLFESAFFVALEGVIPTLSL